MTTFGQSYDAIPLTGAAAVEITSGLDPGQHEAQVRPRAGALYAITESAPTDDLACFAPEASFRFCVGVGLPPVWAKASSGTATLLPIFRGELP